MTKLCALLTVVVGANFALAQINGVREDNYGSALAVQGNNTGFGDSDLGQANYANGSELDAAYCRTSGTDLNLMFTGNLQSNFNKFEIFIDHRPGGRQTLDGSIPGAGALTGLTFDNGFEADLWISVTCGGSPFACYVNAWDLGGGSPSDYLGTNGGSGALTGGNNWLGMGLGLNNSNTAGVAGGGGAADSAAALAVRTGIEISLPQSMLAIVNGAKVCAFINGQNHDYASNQVLGSLPVAGNLGGNGSGAFTGNLSGVDFRQFAGDQFFVLPTPGAAALLGLGGLVAGRRRR
jgi:hypothetical protein